MIELGSVWKHKKKGSLYRVTQVQHDGQVYLEAQSKGSRSTWKYAALVPWDYEQVNTESK